MPHGSDQRGTESHTATPDAPHRFSEGKAPLETFDASKRAGSTLPVLRARLDPPSGTERSL